MLKTVMIPKKNRYVMTLPNEYLNRPIEILVFPFDSDRSDKEAPTTLQLEETLGTGDAEDDQEFWDTFGSWQDNWPVEQIIENIYTSRTILDKISEEQKQLADAVAAVRETWASIPLDLKTAIYIAEDKELEYDV